MGDVSLNYESVLRGWDSRSGVRSKPRRMVTEMRAGKVAFPVNLAPDASHALISKHDPSRLGEILVRRLYLYFDFTTVLEQEIVNPVLLALSKGEAGAELPRAMRLDANRIYVDEAYHALSSVDLNLQVEAASGVRYIPRSKHRFQLGLVSRMLQKKDINPALIMLCAATISETLISGTLAKIPADSTVISTIREAVADHAEDERYHHAFFTRLHEYVWPRLAERERRVLAPLYADFVIDFLMPDVPAQIQGLVVSGFSETQARRIVHESYESVDLVAGARQASRATIRLLKRTGVLQYDEAAERCSDLGLLDTGPMPDRQSLFRDRLMEEIK